jgi:hypothetical protein
MSDEQTTTAQGAEASAESTEDNRGLLAIEPEAEANPEEVAVPHLVGQETEQKTEESEAEEWVRPDYWPEQFWSDEEGPDVEKLAKSYQELRTKMSQGKHKAPADGKYDMTVFKSAGVGEDDDLLQKYVGKARDLGVSQEAFDELAKLYMEEVGAAFENVAVNREAELKKLGPKANDILKANNQWLTKMSRTVLTPQETEAIVKASTSATFVSALNKLRQASGEMAIPVDAEVSAAQGQPSKEDLYAMVGDPRYGKDMRFTREVENMFAKAFDSSPMR